MVQRNIIQFRTRHDTRKGDFWKVEKMKQDFAQIVCVCAHMCTICMCVYIHIHTLRKVVLQTCSLEKLGPHQEHTQQDFTTNWLLIYGATAGLIRLANSGEQRERERERDLPLALFLQVKHRLT